jgi:glycosyltransferase involved in cell wall biosynthesis
MPSGISLLYVATVSGTIRQFLAPYAAHFRALGWRVDAAANGVSTDAAVREAFDHVYELPISRSIFDLAGLALGERTMAKLLESGPNIVHVHTPIAGFITRFAAHRMPPDSRPAVVYTAHGFHFHRDGRAVTNSAFLTAERLAGRWTDKLIVINDEDYEAARRHRIVPRTRLLRMPGIGIDTEVYSPSAIMPGDFARARQELDVRSNVPLFVAVGELNRNKQHDDVIEALRLMRHTEAHLALVGGGPRRAHLEALASRLGLRDRVRFAGFVADVRPLVGSATALVLASKREGLSRSIMEALALEVPVVASTARGNRELVGEASGFVVPTGDIRGLAESMDWLIDHPVERQEMGRTGRRRMAVRYDVGNVVRLHEDLYSGLLAQATRWRMTHPGR